MCDLRSRGKGSRTADWRQGNVSVFVLSRRQARPNTFLTERMSVSVSRLEAGSPSCDSMWLARASRSLDTHSHSLSEWEGGGLQATERPPAGERVTLCTSELWMSFYSLKEAESAVP